MVCLFCWYCSILLSLWLTSGFITAAVNMLMNSASALRMVCLFCWYCSILLSLWLTSGFITAAVHVLDVFAVGVGLQDVLGLLFLLLHVVHAGGRTLHPLCTLFDPAYYPVVFQRPVDSRLHSVLKQRVEHSVLLERVGLDTLE